MLGFRGGSGVELRAGASVKNASLPQTTRARGRLALASPGARSPARDAGHLLSRRAHTWRPALCAAAATRARPPTSSPGAPEGGGVGRPEGAGAGGGGAGRGLYKARAAARAGLARAVESAECWASRAGPGRGEGGEGGGDASAGWRRSTAAALLAPAGVGRRARAAAAAASAAWGGEAGGRARVGAAGCRGWGRRLAPRSGSASARARAGGSEGRRGREGPPRPAQDALKERGGWRAAAHHLGGRVCLQAWRHHGKLPVSSEKLLFHFVRVGGFR